MLELRAYVYFNRLEVCAAREPRRRIEVFSRQKTFIVLSGVRSSQVLLPTK